MDVPFLINPLVLGRPEPDDADVAPITHNRCGRAFECARCGKLQELGPPVDPEAPVAIEARIPETPDPWSRASRDFVCQACGSEQHHQCDYSVDPPERSFP